MQSKHHCREKPYTTAGGQAYRGVKETPDKKNQLICGELCLDSHRTFLFGVNNK
nr:MAG TPA: hypothetical protein [Caudoviricetes sp.]